MSKSLTLPDITFSSLRAARPTDSMASQIVGVGEDVRTGDLRDFQSAQDLSCARLLGAFAWLSLLLATTGTYSVMAFTVVQRRHEIGLRIALGAGHRTVMAIVLKQAAWLAFAGIVFGLGGAYYAHRWMRVTLYDTGPVDRASFAV